MNSYKYTARSASGEKIQGLIEAIDELEAYFADKFTL